MRTDLDFTKLFSINIEKPDMEVFEGPKLAFEAIKRGGSMPTVFNAANEYAVSLFLDEKIRYLDIIEYIKYAMNNHKFIENPNLCDILSIKKDTELGLSEFEKEYRS